MLKATEKTDSPPIPCRLRKNIIPIHMPCQLKAQNGVSPSPDSTKIKTLIKLVEKPQADHITWLILRGFKPISLSKGDSNHAHDQNPDRRQLAEKAAITKKQAGIVLAELCELAAKAIKKGDKFAIPGFVTVKVRARKARIGRNPQTGAAIKIPAKKVVKALPAKALKDIIATKKK